MKNAKLAAVGAVALTFASAVHTFGVVGQALEIQGTNLVLSWPSQGYEYYMIRYWADLSHPSLQLTNCFPANSTNRTTFVLPCCTLAELAGTNGYFLSGVEDLSAASSTADWSSSFDTRWAMPADGSGSAVPFAIYPPGYDTNGLIFFDSDPNPQPTLSSGADALAVASRDGPMPAGFSNGRCDCPDIGFFQVWHIPDFAATITDYVFDGPIFIPVDFADNRDRVDNIKVMMDGEPTAWADYTSLFYNGQTNWGVGIYFDRFTNGTHQIQLVSTLHINDDINENGAYLVLSNLTRTITVSNQLTFPDWNDFIQGDTYTFNAQTANTDTDWQIDIYDAGDNYVNSGSGHTSNGQISWTWDLTDYLGNNRDDFDNDPYFYSYTTFDSGTAAPGDGPQSQTTEPNPVSLKGYPNKGEWLISFQDRWFSDAPGYPSDCQEKFTNAMGFIRGGPILVGDAAMSYPIKFGTNVYTQADRDTSWTNLLAWIGDLRIRNFYYHGHGGATSLGADRHTLDTNGLVSGSALTSKYSKAQIFSWQVALKTRANRYRFVFLDGCDTADGDWPNAFTTSKTNHDLSFYENDPKHRRPSVFVGWTGLVGGETNTSVYAWLNFEQNWMGIWANDSDHPGIKESLERANRTFNWLPQGVFDSKFRVYGYQDMKIEDYNHKGDWRWP